MALWFIYHKIVLLYMHVGQSGENKPTEQKINNLIVNKMFIFVFWKKIYLSFENFVTSQNRKKIKSLKNNQKKKPNFFFKKMQLLILIIHS